jgi:hypothetical protein
MNRKSHRRIVLAVALSIRKFVAEHTDTATTGPATAADWLKELHK